MQSLFAKQALTAEGWQYDVRIDLDGGHIAAITPSAVGAGAYDLLLPGMPNVHSHAFQRAMAGLTEHRGGLPSERGEARSGGQRSVGGVPQKEDNFWSWREVMYRFLERLTPEHVEVIARAFYIELLKAGYTAVGEFHYLHHDPQGNHYANPAEMSGRILAAAEDSGIRLTLLPVLYQSSNFGGVPAVPGQRRFLHSTEAFLKLMEKLSCYASHPSKCEARSVGGSAPLIKLGVAPHSLRAVPPDALKEIVKLSGPVHIHAAEQVKEVEDCLAWSGKRPVEWLLENHAVDERWCLIHATHLNAGEVAGLAKSGAVAGLCPTTEANLGDGIFPAEDYLAAGGRFGIGSDSHIGIDPFAELQLMEYAQRLHQRRRNVLCDASVPSVGRNLYTKAVAGGRQALGIGEVADFVALDCSAPMLACKSGDTLLDAVIFGNAGHKVMDVFVEGVRVVENGYHPLEAEAKERLAHVMQALS